MNRQASGIRVEVLDQRDIVLLAEQEVKRKTGKDVSLAIKGQCGLVRTTKGIFIVESGGHVDRRPLSETNKWPIDLYPVSKGEMEMIPIAVFNLGLKEMGIVSIEQTLPLEGFVLHGTRKLDTNYEICKEFLTKQL